MHSFRIHIFTLLFALNSFAQGKCEHVFIQFAKNQIGKNFNSEMPKNWKTKVTETTKSWDEPEMKEFLNFLINRIGEEETLKRIRAVSYFKLFRFKNFLERVKLYENYIEKEGVNERLKKSLSGFHKNSVKNIKDNIQFIKDYIGEEATRERIEKDLQGFSRANLSELKKVVQFIENYIEKEATREIMKKNLQAFSRINLSELKKIVQFIEDLIGKNAVKDKMRKDLQGFSKVTPNQLKQKEKEWGKQKMKNMLEKYSLQNPIFSL